MVRHSSLFGYAMFCGHVYFNFAVAGPHQLSSCHIMSITGFIIVNMMTRSNISAKISLMSRNACNGENGETGKKPPASGDLNWMPKVAPWRLAMLAKMAILAKLAILAKIATHAMAKMAKLAKNHQPLAI